MTMKIYRATYDTSGLSPAFFRFFHIQGDFDDPSSEILWCDHDPRNVQDWRGKGGGITAMDMDLDPSTAATFDNPEEDGLPRGRIIRVEEVDSKTFETDQERQVREHKEQPYKPPDSCGQDGDVQYNGSGWRLGKRGRQVVARATTF